MKFALGDEAPGAALSHERAEVGAVTARGQNHGGLGPVLARQPRRHLEPVEVRQLYVEEHHVRVELLRLLEGSDPIFCLADDLETFGLKEGAGRRSKARVVVNDQDARQCVHMVTSTTVSRHTASHTVFS
jgi:hypothetical protein